VDAVTAIVNARHRLPELRFFLALMDQVELDNTPLTDVHSPHDEFTFLLNAFVNAGYSVTAYLKDAKLASVFPFRARVTRFREVEHRAIYGSGSAGGWRTIAVHYQPVKPALHGYRAPPHDKVWFRFRQRHGAQQANKPRVVDFAATKRFYFTTDSPQNSICDQCEMHVHALGSLIDECEAILAASPSGART
jgi:hypothetical protein